MRVLVTGVTGQLGHDCVLELKDRGIEVQGVSSREFPLTDAEAMRRYMAIYKPTCVIHCAAYTAVDRAEDDDAPKGPTNVYGKSKLMGEEAVSSILRRCFIVRISWVFGINGKNFIRTMLRLGQSHAKLTVVDDQVGSPTYTRDLSVLLADMIQTERYGVYHATNEGFCSWAELAAEVFRQAGMPVVVEPVPSSAYPTRAVRPHNSRMSKRSLTEAGFSLLPRWQDAVGRYLIELESLREQQEDRAE